MKYTTPGRIATLASIVSLLVASIEAVSVGSYIDRAHLAGNATMLRKSGIRLDFVSDFFNIDGAGFERSSMKDFAIKVKQADKNLKKIFITLQPIKGLGVLGDTSCKDIAAQIKYADDLGFNVTVRFGHEMNGWPKYYEWQGNPSLYVEKFRKVTNAIRAAKATKARMLWAPLNIYKGLPNETPYYPGDKYVDLVGLTVLPNRDTDVIKDLLHTKLTYKYQYPHEDSARSFVERYSRKPFVIAETDNPTNVSTDPVIARRHKAQWMNQLLKESKKYKWITGIHFLEVTKPGYDAMRNYGFLYESNLRTYVKKLQAVKSKAGI